MKKLILTLIFALIIFSSGLFALPKKNLAKKNKIEITQLSAKSIQLNLHIEDYDFEEITINGNEFDKINLDNLNCKIRDEINSFQVPFISEIIGLPVDGNFSIYLSHSEFIYIENKNFLYNPDMSEDGGIVSPDYSNIPDCCSMDAYFPEKIIRKNVSGFVGNRLLGALKIFPVQYNPVQKRVKLYTDLTIEIQILGNTSTSKRSFSSSYIDGISNELIINNEFSKYWRKEREKVNNQWQQRDESVINSFKIYVNEKGLYKISYSFLKDTVAVWQDSLESEYQFDFDIDEMNPKNLTLLHKGEPIPIYLHGENDFSFDEGDYIEFFADINHGENCFYDNYSLENCFVLHFKEGQNGARMAVEDCGLYETDPREYTRPYYFDTTLHFEEQQIYAYLSRVYNTPEDLWFWRTMMAPNLDYFNVTIPDPIQTNARQATITAVFMGQSYPKEENTARHHAQVFINNSLVGDSGENWIGQTPQVISGSISNENLNDGTNNFYISLPGDTDATVDKILLDYIDITYWRECLADDNYLEFNKPSSYDSGLFQFEVNEFDSTNLNVYKIGVSKLENISIESTMPEGGAPFILSFQDEVYDNETKYVALSESRKLLPAKIIPDIPSNLHDEFNQADYLLISKRDFLQEEGVDEFIAHWQNEKSLTIMPIAIENIFDEFNGGIRSPQAIKDFLSYAYNNWQEPNFQYVNLLGDGGTDERWFSYKKEFSIIPVKTRWTYHIGATADDNWYACVVGDDELPDFMISRTPVWDVEQVNPVLEKSIYYNENPNYSDIWRNHCLFIAGGSGTFEDQLQRLGKEYFSDSYRVSKIYAQRSSEDPLWGGTTDLKDNIDDGTAYIQFMGHGGGQIWSDLNLMDLADIPTLFNDNYPIITSMTCYTSNFAGGDQLNCLGEAFILEPQKGAIGFFGSVAKGFLNQDEYFSEFLLDNICNRNVVNVAKAMNVAKIEYYLHYGYGGVTKTFLRAFNYLGDPAIDVAFPQKSLDVTLNQSQVIKGDTIQIYINSEDSTLNNVSYYVTDTDRLVSPISDPEELEQIEYYQITRRPYYQTGYEYVTNPNIVADEYARVVHSYAYDDTSDYMGYSMFTVGKSTIFDIHTIPSPACLGDSLVISASICGEENLDSIRCIYWSDKTMPKTMPMEKFSNITYHTSGKTNSFNSQANLFYQFDWCDSLGEHRISNETENFDNWNINPAYGKYYFETDLGTWTINKGMCQEEESVTGKSIKISNKQYACLETPEIQHIGNLSFMYKIDFSEINHPNSRRPQYAVQYRETSSGGWNSIAIFNPSENMENFEKFNYNLNKTNGVKIRIQQINAETIFAEDSGICIDDFWASDPNYDFFELNGPDLKMLEFSSTIQAENPCFKITLRNIGNITFPKFESVQKSYSISIFDGNDLVDSILANDRIAPTETKTFYVPNPLPSGIYHLSARANPDSLFPETYYENNSKEEDLYLNFFIVHADSTTIHSSLDSACEASFPAGTVTSNSFFFINETQVAGNTFQPDISAVKLIDEEFGSYEIAPVDSSVLNQDGAFKKDISLKFFYSQTDSLTQQLAEDRKYKIFRYDLSSQCWILCGGDTNLNENYISYNFVKQPGTYSLFYNGDVNSPTIGVNVEGQEFTDGEYVNSEAIFSFLLQDENGINTEEIDLHLDGEDITDYIVSRNNIKSVPVKYQVDVEEGNHTIFISVTDNSGNYRERIVNFSVQTDFNIIHIGNYPNPVSSNTSNSNNEGRTRFTYTLTTEADDISIQIYTVSGRLINEIKNLSTACGYHEYPRAAKGWNCVDFDGRKLANGVYFYKIIAKRGNEKIERIEKMAILR
ncbi:MAG: C25 family cysteine peptidase [Candidatus Cloacimonadota bacterium]|nr:C25 family cysteine peptidase [Candidatus Cloacimonadota bacterium]